MSHKTQRQQFLFISSRRDTLKDVLLQQIAATPSNAPNSPSATKSILSTIRELEELCPMEMETMMTKTTTTSVVDQNNDDDNNDGFLIKLAGNWGLLWTTQDERSDEWSLVGPFRRWINPLENQVYSSNPFGRKKNNDQDTERTGRANPILPRPIQDRLEAIGWIDTDTTSNDTNNNDNRTTEPLVRSSQSIDLTRTAIRNVVTFEYRLFPTVTAATIIITNLPPSR